MFLLPGVVIAWMAGNRNIGPPYSQPQFPGGNCCLEKKVKQLETVSNVVIAWMVTDTHIPPVYAAEIINYLVSHANPVDGFAAPISGR
jgi:hypothetical protein